MNFEEFLNLIPKDIIERAREDIDRVNEELRAKDAVRQLGKSNVDGIGVYTDGSNVVSERRGCGIAVFSSVSVIYTSESGGRALKTVTVDPEKTLLILLPKANIVSRSNTIMRGLEYTTAFDAIDENTNLVVFDGSYVTSLIDPKTSVREVYTEIYRILKSFKWNWAEIYYAIIESINSAISEFLSELNKLTTSKEKTEFFLTNYYKVYSSVMEEIESSTPKKILNEIKAHLQNYIFMLVEQNFASQMLLNVLEKSEKNKIPVVWVSKDTESRLITKTLKSIALANDQTLLDFILDNYEYLLVEKAVEFSKVKPETFTIDYVDDIKYYEKTFAVTRNLAETLYTRYSDYGIVYAKLNGPVLQLSYPKRLVGEKDLEFVLSVFIKISHMGYPKPLIYVHNRSTLRERLTRVISEGIYRICVDREKRFLCNLLQKSGREQVLY